MNKRTFLKTLGLAALIRPTNLFAAPAMDSWPQLANNRAVNGIQLQQAVNLGFFTAKTTIPQTEHCFRRNEITTYVNVNPIPGDGQRLVIKGQLVSTSIYFAITGCYWLPDDGTTGENPCNTIGDEVYYSLNPDGWDNGDVVLKYEGGQYLPISNNYDINTSLSYTRNGVRSFIIIEGYNGVVLSQGSC